MTGDIIEIVEPIGKEKASRIFHHLLSLINHSECDPKEMRVIKLDGTVYGIAALETWAFERRAHDGKEIVAIGLHDNRGKLLAVVDANNIQIYSKSANTIAKVTEVFEALLDADSME